MSAVLTGPRRDPAEDDIAPDCRWASFFIDFGGERLTVFQVFSEILPEEGEPFRTLICDASPELPYLSETPSEVILGFLRAASGERAVGISEPFEIALIAVRTVSPHDDIEMRFRLSDLSSVKVALPDSLDDLAFLRVDIQTDAGYLGFSYRRVEESDSFFELTVLAGNRVLFRPSLLRWVCIQHRQPFFRENSEIDMHGLLSYLNLAWKG